MASGHVNRANRPNTWLHRPSLRREDSSCQPGAVHTWHLADVNSWANVRFALPAQPVDATQALNLSAGVSNAMVLRGRSFSWRATLFR